MEGLTPEQQNSITQWQREMGLASDVLPRWAQSAVKAAQVKAAREADDVGYRPVAEAKRETQAVLAAQGVEIDQALSSPHEVQMLRDLEKKRIVREAVEQAEEKEIAQQTKPMALKRAEAAQKLAGDPNSGVVWSGPVK